jgi:STE24 endopeptidase
VDVGDDGDAHRRPATLSRAALAVSAVAWAVAAFLLLRTRVPDLELPRVDPRDFFPAAALDRIETYRALTRWLWVGSTATELLVLGLLAWKARPLAERCSRLLRAPGRSRLGVGVALALLASLAVWVATLPFGAVGHWWERRYGLSDQGFGAWLGDSATSLAVTAVLLSLAVAGAVWLAGRFGRRWWIPGGLALALLGVVVALAQPLVISPLFNRFTPLQDERLAVDIERLGARLGVSVDRVEIADASRRTTAANAQVIGIGPTRRVVLDDTLLDGRFSRSQILAVSAHELAHVARHHVWKGVAWFALFAIPGTAFVAWVAGRRGGLADSALVPLALLCAFAFFVATLPAQNAISRRYEAEADWLALTATRDPESAIALQRRFALTGLIDPTPPAWSEILLATHPTVLDRIAMAEAFRRRS